MKPNSNVALNLLPHVGSNYQSPIP